MTTKLRLTVVNARGAIDEARWADGGEVTLDSTGDAAKAVARAYVARHKQAYRLRSLNWAPDPGKPDMLLGYLEGKR